MKWEVVLNPSKSAHFTSSLTDSKCRAIFHQLVDGVQTQLKWHPLWRPTCLVQNSHFKSQRIMALSQFCKGPEKQLWPADRLTPDHYHRIPAKGPCILSLGQRPHHLSRRVPRTSPPLLDPTSLTSSLTRTPSAPAIWPPLLLVPFTQTPASGPLHWLFPLPRMFFCRIFTWLVSSSSSHLCPCHLLSEAFPDHRI